MDKGHRGWDEQAKEGLILNYLIFFSSRLLGSRVYRAAIYLHHSDEVFIISGQVKLSLSLAGVESHSLLRIITYCQPHSWDVRSASSASYI